MNVVDVFSGKRILITGATGLLGSHLVNAIMACPTARVVAVGRSRQRLQAVFSPYQDDARLEMVEHDVGLSFPALEGGVDWIFHAASPISGAVIKDRPASVVVANMCGSFHCLEFLRKQRESTGVSGAFVVFSSATVYGNPSSESDVVCDEDATDTGEALGAITAAYSESKRMSEVMALAYGRECGLDIRIARFGYVYGPCPVPPKTAFYEFVADAKAGRDLVFRNGGFGRRDNIFVDDAVNGLMYICAYGTSGEPYNVSSNGDLGNFAAIDEMASAIARAANKQSRDVKVVVGPASSRASGVRLDNARLKALGWSVTVSLSDGIYSTYMAHGGFEEGASRDVS